MNLIKKTQKTIQSHKLIKPGDTILIGISGGADSVALLEILFSLRNEIGLKLVACHINHGLRKSADTDQRFVERLCKKKELPCKCIKISIPKNPKDSLEQIAREKRFAALINTAKKNHADAVALGHHQNDLAETVLMRIIRGSGLQGLQAILPKRKINGMTFIRPLIEQRKEDIEDFLNSQKIPFRNDPTNTDTAFLRNKIRHQLLQYLSKSYNPNIHETLARLAETTSLDYEFLSETAERAFEKISSLKSKVVTLNTQKLKKYHPAIQRMILRIAIIRTKGSSRTITLKHIQNIETFLRDTSLAKGNIRLPLDIKVTKTLTSAIFQQA